MANTNPTPFSAIYERFYSKVTDDMYMEYTLQETKDMAEDLLISAVHKFQFPRVALDYELNAVEEEVDGEIITSGTFVYHLDLEEINILATYMIVEWLGQQLATVQLVRMKYSGSEKSLT